MKKILCLLVLNVILAINVLNAVAQRKRNNSPLSQRVAEAKIIKGLVDLKPQKALYVEIPSTGGYLEFKLDNFKEVPAILKEVERKFAKEFKGKSNFTHAPNCKWDAIPNAHPSTAQYRYCRYSENICYWQTCNCATCCGN